MEHKYEVGEWYVWAGGECPLHEGTIIDCKLGSKDLSSLENIRNYTSDSFDWEHYYQTSNLVAFKVVSYPEDKPKTQKVTLELTEEQIQKVEDMLGE